MDYREFIKEIGRGAHGARDLNEQQAEQLFGDMLDGKVPDLMLGAIVIALRVKSESMDELHGFQRALDARIHHFQRPFSDVLPVVLPAYNGARHQANLTPLLALLLARLNVPVLVHGAPEVPGRTSTAEVFAALGIQPARSLSEAQHLLDEGQPVYVSTALLSPGLERLLALRWQIGVRNSAHSLAKMIAPFESDCLRVVSVSHPDYLVKMREFFADTHSPVQLLRGTEGEPFANPKRRPLIEHLAADGAKVLFEAEMGPIKSLPSLPAAIDAGTTAAWINKALEGRVPVPTPIMNQLAALLYASGYARDLHHAKAMVATQHAYPAVA